jgi:hypothetical protein
VTRRPVRRRAGHARLSTIDQAPTHPGARRAIAQRAAQTHVIAAMPVVAVAVLAAVRGDGDGFDLDARVAGILVLGYTLTWWGWLLSLRSQLARHGLDVGRTSRAGLIQAAAVAIAAVVGLVAGEIAVAIVGVVALAVTPAVAGWWAAAPAVQPT